MNCSIDLMKMLFDESGDAVRMNRRGYLYVTADWCKVTDLENASNKISNLGAGPLRVHSVSALYYQPASEEVFHDQPTGANPLMGSELIRKYFPYRRTRGGCIAYPSCGLVERPAVSMDSSDFSKTGYNPAHSSLLFYKACGVQS